MRTVGKTDDAPVEPEEFTLAHLEPGTGRGDAGERNSADVTAAGRSSGSPSAPRAGVPQLEDTHGGSDCVRYAVRPCTSPGASWESSSRAGLV